MRFRLLTAVLLLCGMTSLGHADVLSNFVAWYTFDEAGNKVLDRSGKGNHLTLTNGPIRVQGRTSQAVLFDGADDCASLPVSNFNGTGALSITLWVKPISLTTNGRMVMLAGDNTRFRIAASGALNLTSNNGTSSASSTTGVLVVGSWVHIATTRDSAGTAKFYANGVDVTSTTTSGTPGSGTSIVLGAADSCAGILANVVEEDVRIYSVQLSQSQIQNIYRSTLTPVDDQATLLNALTVLATARTKRRITIE